MKRIIQGECFGLLGINGAGKTTTFKILTGDIGATAGDAFLSGHSVTWSVKDAQRKFGYCPQFDALIDQLTVRETMFMYARLRGIAEASIAASIDNLISIAMLQKHRSKQAGNLRSDVRSNFASFACLSKQKTITNFYEFNDVREVWGYALRSSSV